MILCTVHVQLDQPLWSTSHQRSSHTADILSYCIQLDTMITPHNTNITVRPLYCSAAYCVLHAPLCLIGQYVTMVTEDWIKHAQDWYIHIPHQ